MCILLKFILERYSADTGMILIQTQRWIWIEHKTVKNGKRVDEKSDEKSFWNL